MFLHSGAGLHGHEYTTQRRSSEIVHRKQILLRSSMRQPLTEETRRFSTPFASTEPRDDQEQARPSSNRPTSLPIQARSVSESARHRDHSVRFRDQPHITHFSTPVHSEDEESIAESQLTVDSDVSSRRRRKQRLPRKSTTFALAHPAPGVRTKQRRLVQFRPKVLLQLQELGEKRAVPAFDIVPSSQIAGSFIIPVLAKRFPRMFRAKPNLGQNDLLLMRSENYNISTPAVPGNDTNEAMGERDVLAVVSVNTHEGTDRAELTFRDGSTWFIEAIANGSYEMKRVDGSSAPMKGRWVRRLTSLRTNSMESGIAAPAQPMQDKWTFSILDPAARRHPIMGVLTSTSLEIYDNYNTMSTSSSRYPPTKSFVSGNGLPHEEYQSPAASVIAEERKTVAVTEYNKMLMMVSATWISLRQAGWPATANPKMARSMSQRCSLQSDYPRGSLSDSRESSGEFKPQDGTSHQRRKSTGCTPHPQPPVRSLSAASHFMRKQQELRQQDSSQAGSMDGRNTPDSVSKPIPRKRTMTKLASWLRNCFGGDGSAQKRKT
ncbi:hypothetical protein LMH87_007030 [Akanthomyces muscarius]|uniref:Uncharacterized protein n=1 Tax=Akanthomyces muscarius TaxID=2231603 RepID=A0A9W8QRF2_AKAMU|nr:hypothetical protein LMH87_007030 [Akanthomyces muscarius]KAJ4165396.1 hypothetical protein LMH87_007030 [Akanthomyces muscarius]